MFIILLVHVKNVNFFLGNKILLSLPFNPIIVEAPFQQWGIDFVGPFDKKSINEFKYILTCTDYFTRWVEVVPTKKATAEVIIKFLEENIMSRYGCPLKLTTDNAKDFSKI